MTSRGARTLSRVALLMSKATVYLACGSVP